MSNDLHRKLIDLYAGDELPEELEDHMEMVAFNDPEFNHDMTTLKRTVDMLHESEDVEFTEESYQRVLMKLYARGAEIKPKAKDPFHLQYHLPMQG